MSCLLVKKLERQIRMVKPRSAVVVVVVAAAAAVVVAVVAEAMLIVLDRRTTHVEALFDTPLSKPGKLRINLREALNSICEL